MVEWKTVCGDKELDGTLGPAEKCGGLLMYTPEGYVSVWISKKIFPHFKSNSINGGSDEEKIRAYESFHGYSGYFLVDEENHKITHCPLYGAFPNMLNKELVKDYFFDGSYLKLVDTTIKINGMSNHESFTYLVWKKIF